MKKMRKSLWVILMLVFIFNTTACTKSHSHSYGSWMSNGDGTHTRVCQGDASHVQTENCGGGTATCTSFAICDKCKQPYGAKAAHTFTAEVAEDDYLKSRANCQSKAVYYKSCSVCGAVGEETFEHGEVGEHNFNLKKVEQRYLKSPKDCQHKAVYYRSCGTCGEGSKNDADTFEDGEVGDHSFTEQAEGVYLKTPANCQHKAVYYKSCSECGEQSSDTFEAGETGDHVFDKRNTDASYAVADQEDRFYYSCSVCEESSHGKAGEKTFKGYTQQDDSWNIVSEAFIHDYQDTTKKYDSTARYHYNGGSRVAEDVFSVAYLEDITGGVGGKTEGIYYKVDIQEPGKHVWYGFNLLPSHEKSVYESYLAMNPNATLTFEVYCQPEGGWSDNQNRQTAINAIDYGTSVSNKVHSQWHTFTIPVSTLITNWDAMHTAEYAAGDGVYRERALFNYSPTYNDTTDTSFVYYIGNFKIEGLSAFITHTHVFNKRNTDEKYAVAGQADTFYFCCSVCGESSEGHDPSKTFTIYTQQDDSWNIVSEAFISDTTVRYYNCNDSGVFLPCVAEDAVSVAYLEDITGGVGGKTEGIYYKVAVQSPKANVWQGFTVLPGHEKTVYESYLASNPNAALTFDVYFQPEGGYTGNLRLTATNALGSTVKRENKAYGQWHTFSIPLATLIEDWSFLYAALSDTSTGAYYQKALFSYMPTFNSATDTSFVIYIGNFTVAGLDDFITHPHVYDKRNTDAKYAVAGQEDMFYYSCSVCGESSEGQDPPKTFKGYTKQDDSWNIVSDAFIHDYQDTTKKYDSTARYYNNGGSRVAESVLSVVYLEDVTGGVGGKTAGIYYKVDIQTASKSMWYGFTVLPSQEKSVYEAYVAAHPNAALTFDVYFQPEGGNSSNMRLTAINALDYGSSVSQKEFGQWHTFRIPLSTLIKNWDALHTAEYAAGDGVYRVRGLFNYSPTYGTSPNDATDTSFVFYIGNFKVDGLAA